MVFVQARTGLVFAGWEETRVKAGTTPTQKIRRDKRGTLTIGMSWCTSSSPNHTGQRSWRKRRLDVNKEKGKILVSLVTPTSMASGPASVCAWSCAPGSSPEPTLTPLVLLLLTSRSHGWDSAPCWKSPGTIYSTAGGRSSQVHESPTLLWHRRSGLRQPLTLPFHLRSRVRNSSCWHAAETNLSVNEKALSQYWLFTGYFVRKIKESTPPGPCNAPFPLTLQ